MLRRNFLKFLGLLPITLISKQATGSISANLEYGYSRTELSKYYAIVQLDRPFQTIYPENSQYFGLCSQVEIEISAFCKPEIGQLAYLMEDGTVNIVPESLNNYFGKYISNYLGVFLTRAYKKEESQNNHIRMDPRPRGVTMERNS